MSRRGHTWLWTRGAVAELPPEPDDEILLSDPTFYLVDYTALPWLGAATLGVSGDHQFALAAGAPAAGPDFGSHPTLNLGPVPYLVGELAADDSALTCADVISNTALGLQFVVEVNNFSAPGAPYAEKNFFSSLNGNFYCNGNTDGVRGGFYDGTDYRVTAAIPLATGTKACIQMVYDGADVKVRVNGSAWETVAAANVHSSVMGSQPKIGSLDMILAQAVGWNRAPSDAEFDSFLANAEARFAF